MYKYTYLVLLMLILLSSSDRLRSALTGSIKHLNHGDEYVAIVSIIYQNRNRNTLLILRGRLFESRLIYKMSEKSKINKIGALCSARAQISSLFNSRAKPEDIQSFSKPRQASGV